MGELLFFPQMQDPSWLHEKASIEKRFGISYADYLAFSMGYAGKRTEIVGKKIARALRKELMIVRTMRIAGESNYT